MIACQSINQMQNQCYKPAHVIMYLEQRVPTNVLHACCVFHQTAKPGRLLEHCSNLEHKEKQNYAKLFKLSGLVRTSSNTLGRVEWRKRQSYAKFVVQVPWPTFSPKV